jgi:hypothetical protein
VIYLFQFVELFYIFFFGTWCHICYIVVLYMLLYYTYFIVYIVVVYCFIVLFFFTEKFFVYIHQYIKCLQSSITIFISETQKGSTTRPPPISWRKVRLPSELSHGTVLLCCYGYIILLCSILYVLNCHKLLCYRHVYVITCYIVLCIHVL